jgi:hypothetical protein
MRRPAAYSRSATLFGWVLLVALLGTMACGDSTGPATCNATGVGQIAISAGVSPSITWVADCRAERLAVFVVATGAAVWELRAGSKGIPKPVAYGIVSAGVREEHSAEPLQAGTAYGVLVTIVTSTASLSAVAGFTP